MLQVCVVVGQEAAVGYCSSDVPADEEDHFSYVHAIYCPFPPRVSSEQPPRQGHHCQHADQQQPVVPVPAVLQQFEQEMQYHGTPYCHVDCDRCHLQELQVISKP